MKILGRYLDDHALPDMVMYQREIVVQVDEYHGQGEVLIPDSEAIG